MIQTCEQARDRTEVLLIRARWLAPQDRALFEAVYREGVEISQLARLRGLPTRCVRRKAKALRDRLVSAEFIFVYRHKDEWDGLLRQVAIETMLRGRSIKETAEMLCLGYHKVRSMRAHLLARMEEAQS